MTQLNVRLKPCYEVWHALQIAGRIMLIYTWQAYMLNPKPTHYMCLIMCCWMPFPSLSALKILYIASGCKLLWFHSSFGLQDSISFHFSLFHICTTYECISKVCNSESLFILCRVGFMCLQESKHLLCLLGKIWGPETIHPWMMHWMYVAHEHVWECVRFPYYIIICNWSARELSKEIHIKLISPHVNFYV